MFGQRLQAFVLLAAYERVDMEIWKIIQEYPDYEASNYGNIRNQSTHKQLMQRPNRDTGYMTIRLYKNKKVKSLSVHRLICKTFFGNPMGNCEVAHLDNNKQNNRVENLIWASKKENMSHQIIHGTRAIGEKHGTNVISQDLAITIKTLLQSGTEDRHIANSFNIPLYIVRNIKYGKAWRWLNV